MSKKNTASMASTVIKVCVGLHCAIEGSYSILDALKDRYKLEIGIVSDDGILLEELECIRDCENAIPILVNGVAYNKTSFKSIVKYIDAVHINKLSKR